MKEKNILIVTEANHRVASGHLYESVVCYQELKKFLTVYLMVNADMPQQFKAMLGEHLEYQTDIQQEVECLLSCISQHHIRLIVFNLREIHNQFINEIRKKTDVYIVCIDEFGRRALDADMIINPMIGRQYWNYESKAEIYCGAEYLVLPPVLVKYHEAEKQIRESVHLITVSMGGVDAPGTTLKLARWLTEINKTFRINLVLGGGFSARHELEQIVGDNERITIYQNIDFLYDLFYESDLAICAGGNTLHELSAIGTPTLVIPSMPHELQNGKMFQEKGFGIVCGMADEVDMRQVEVCLDRCRTVSVREKMMCAGKKISDGKGYKRVCDLIMRFWGRI